MASFAKVSLAFILTQGRRDKEDHREQESVKLLTQFNAVSSLREKSFQSISRSNVIPSVILCVSAPSALK